MQQTTQTSSGTLEISGIVVSCSGGAAFWTLASGRASIFVHVILGYVATSVLVVGGIESVLASSGVTIGYLLVASLLRFKEQQPAALFCGTFAGMTSLGIFFNGVSFRPGVSFSLHACIAILTGFFYVLIMHFECKLPKRLFCGFGGRLGAIAFLGSAVCLTTTGLLMRPCSDGFQVVSHYGNAGFSENLVPAMIIVSAVGSFVTRNLARAAESTIPGLSVVLSASLSGFVGGGILLSAPAWGHGANLYWFAGNFAGMTSASILDSYPKILFAGAITGFILAGLSHYGSGAGGLLGFSAFLAVIALNGTIRLFSKPEFA